MSLKELTRSSRLSLRHTGELVDESGQVLARASADALEESASLAAAEAAPSNV